jgi:gamma-glutamyltranspeptidase
VGVPGELKGLELAHARHGRLSWAEVVQPALELARDGVPVNANLAHEIQIEAKKYHLKRNVDVDFGLRALLTHHDSWDTPLLEGDLLINKKLADTLEAVRDGGADALYKGERAAQLAEDIQSAGGIITKEDIENYRATLRTPVVAHDISGFSIVGVPPPSSGGATIVGAARFLSGYTSPLSSFPDTLARHRTVESLKHAFAIRMSLSDPDFNTETVQNATKDLLEGTFMEQLRRASHDDTCLPLSQYGGAKWSQLNDDDGKQHVEDANEGDRRRRRLRQKGGRHFGYLNDHGTSHLAVVDENGNAVSMTTSVNTYFGSNVVSQSSGIVLSNTMDDFSSPGRPNYFGLHPSEANYISPGKKPLSSMSPTFVFRRYKETGTGTLGNLMLVLGASGGPKIISAVFSIIVNYVLLGMPLFESIIRPRYVELSRELYFIRHFFYSLHYCRSSHSIRLHDQLIYHGAAVTTLEDTILLSGPGINVTQQTRVALTKRGHALLDVNYEGTVQAIAIDQENGDLSAACDVRKGGSPAGY